MRAIGYLSLVLIAAFLGGAGYALLESNKSQHLDLQQTIVNQQQQITKLHHRVNTLSSELVFEQSMNKAQFLRNQDLFRQREQKQQLAIQQQLTNLQEQLNQAEAINLQLEEKLAALSSSEKKYRNQYFALKRSSTKQQQELFHQFQAKQQLLEAQNSLAIQKQRVQLEKQYSKTAKLTQVEQRVDQLMTSFSALKVDMDIVNTCDKQYLERYGQAKSLLSQMRAFVQKNEMSNDYYQFVISNDAQISRKTREICLEE